MEKIILIDLDNFQVHELFLAYFTKVISVI